MLWQAMTFTGKRSQVNDVGVGRSGEQTALEFAGPAGYVPNEASEIFQPSNWTYFGSLCVMLCEDEDHECEGCCWDGR